MKVMWRRKTTDDADCKSKCSSVKKGHNKEGRSSKKAGKSSKKDKKLEEKTNPKKPKWALSRPPPVQTDYQDDEVDPAHGMPRISIELSMNELQEEAMARGIDRYCMPATKHELLEFLVDGSIHLRRTKAWMDVENLKDKMKADCRRIEEEKTVMNEGCSHTASQSESDSDNEDQFHVPAMRGGQFDEIPEPLTFSTTREHSQVSSLQSTLPSRQVYNNGYKQERELAVRPSQRSVALRPDSSFNSNEELDHETAMATLWSFFHCGVPGCGARPTRPRPVLSPTRKKGDRRKNKEMEQAMERQKEALPWKAEGSVAGGKPKMNPQWDAMRQFEPWIISPPHNNRKPGGSMMKGFTIWVSISSDVLDQCPPKQFDATYKNLSDANDRARFIFFWRNPWRMPPAKMAELVLIKSDNSGHNNDGASTFHCVHPNGDKWIVSVVHDATFKYLDNAENSRHSFDQDYH